jgi:hypothetical protein
MMALQELEVWSCTLNLAVCVCLRVLCLGTAHSRAPPRSSGKAQP